VSFLLRKLYFNIYIALNSSFLFIITVLSRFAEGSEKKARKVSALLNIMIRNPAQLQKELQGSYDPAYPPSPLEIAFLDVGAIAPVSAVDGVHYPLEAQQVIADAVALKLTHMLYTETETDL
jgi:cyanate lyase